MALTPQKVRNTWIPLNISRANNITDFRNELAVYNDSVNLYNAITTVIDDYVTGFNGTDLTNTPAGTTLTIESSTGDDTILPAATTALAGVMTSMDKVNLNALATLSGVALGSLNLGSFTGGLIPDNRTIKQALQALETSIEDGSGLPLGDLTSTTNDITVTGGTGAVFVPTGVTLTLVPGNISLTEFGGELGLDQIEQGGASSGQVLQWNGSTWTPTSEPAIDHNDLDNIQGGQASQYYHINSSLYNVLTSSSASRLVGRTSASGGAVQAITVPNSVTLSGTTLQLVNDAASPGNSYYYGTDSGGTKGFFELPTGSGSLNTASDSADIDFTIVSDDITAELTTTGVIPAEYGAIGSTLILEVDDKGRVLNLNDAPISIVHTQVSNWTSAIENGNYNIDGDWTVDGDWTFTENVTANSAPTLGSHLVNKAYVDTLLATGINSIAVEVATTTAGTLASDFENGDTIDGIVLATGDYILIKDQASLPTNGIYIVQASGAPTRAPEMDAAAEVDGTVVVVKNGTANAGTLWITASDVTTLGVEDIEFVNINTPFSPSLGTSNQLYGMDAAGAADEWKTLSGTSNQITVTHGVGTVTLATPQNIATTSSPTFRDLTLSDTSAALTITSSAAGASISSSSPTSAIASFTVGNTYVNVAATSLESRIQMVDSSTSGATSTPFISMASADGAALASGDRLGLLSFLGSYEASTNTARAASIEVFADAVFSGTSSPGRLVFSTTPSGTLGTATERMRIDNAGVVHFRAGSGIRLYDSDNTNYVAIVPPSTGTLTADYTLTLPTTDGTSGYLLTTDGSGVLSWTDPTTVGGGVDTLYSADGTIGASRLVTLDPGVSLNIAGDATAFLEIGDDYLDLATDNATFAVYPDSITIDSSGAGGQVEILGDVINIVGGTSIAIDLGSDANGDIYYRNSSGNIARLPIGSAAEVLTVTGGLPAWEAASSGSAPAGSNYNLQYYNSGAFGADSNITVTPGAQMKLAVGTSTPAATLHAKNHNDAGSSTLLAENSSGNNIFQVLSSGYTQWGDNESLPRIYQTTTTGSSVSYTGGGLTVEGFVSAGASYDVFGITHTSITDGSDGPFVVQKITGTHAPSSGAGDYVSLKIAPTINQTGTHTGDGYGIQVAPALTSIGDNYVAYLAAVNSVDSFGFLQEGANAVNAFDGSLGIGTVAPATELEVIGTTTSGHYISNQTGVTATLTGGFDTVYGTGASIGITGTDMGFEVTLNTGTSISSLGSTFYVTFESAFTTAPVAVYSPSNIKAATYHAGSGGAVIDTSTSEVTFAVLGDLLDESSTYKWMFIVMG